MQTYDVQDKSQEILEYAKSQVFSVFYSSELGAVETFVQASWNKPDQWREFFTIARKEDINIIIATIRTLSKQDIPEEGDLVDDFHKFSEYAGKVGFYEFTWVKSGVKYSLSDTAHWYREYRGLVEKKDKSALATQAMSSSNQASSRLTQLARELLQDLKAKPVHEFVQELVAFMKEGSKQDWTRRYKTLESMKLYWSNKGLGHDSTLEPEISATMRIIEEQAYNILIEEQLQREKNMMPKLEEECAEWGRNKNFHKMKKSEMMAFLAEKEQTLSREAQGRLWENVNERLKSH